MSLLRHLSLVLLIAASASAQELNDKATRYYETLLKRPAPGPVFDRFVDAWLDSGTLEQLETFLAGKAKAEPSAATHLLLGLYHVRQGAHAKAVEQYRAALTLEPANAGLWQQKALAEARLLEFDHAIASLEKGLEQKPADDLALTMRQLLGRLLARAGRTTDALAVWQKLMAERPDDEALREDVLDLQLAEGLYDAAVENAAALVERAPDAYKKAMRRLQSAEVLDRASRTDAAMKELEQCLADSGADSWLEKEVLARLDRIFRRDDNLSGLRTHLEALAQRQPQRHGVQRARVRLLAELGEKSAAVEAGRALLALAPGDRAAREEFIALLVEAGRLEEAVAQSAELVRQAPDDRELLLKLAALKLQAGDKPGCLAAVTEFDKLSGPDEAARLRSAALLEKAGVTEEAITRLQTAAKEFPASAAVSGALASSLHKAKRRDEALTEWKRMAAAAAGPALQDVARALSAHGEDEAAWEILLTKAASGEAPLLTQLCQLAERLDRADEALPHARRLVGMAQSAPDMEAALELTSRLIKRAGETDAVIASIGADAGVADLCLLAELLEMRGDSAAAEDALSRAAQASPDMAAAQLVRLYRLRQAWPQALEAGAKLFASPGGKKAATAQMLADIAERARNLEAALRWTREWRKLSPGAAPAVLAESRLLRAMGKDDEALQSLRLASGQFEENKEIREELARLSRDTGRTSEALSLYAGLYEQTPDQTARLRIVHEWAEAAQEANRLPELLEQFDERRRQNRNATGPLLALAEIHAVNEDREKQRRALTDAARLRPEDADLALSLAGMQAEDDLIPLAMDTLRAALPHDKSGRVRHRLARLHFDTGDESQGMKLLEEPEDGTPPDAAAVESMALAITPTDPERALALLEPRITADPGDYRLRFLRASIQAELGRHAEAVREWAALLAIKQESQAVTARRASSVLSPAAEVKLKQYAGTVPEELLHVLRVHDLVSAENRQNQWSTRYNQGNQAPSTYFQPRLPGNVLELRALASAALLKPGEEEEVTKLAADALTADGMSGLAALLSALGGNEDPFAPGVPRSSSQMREAMAELLKPSGLPGAEAFQPVISGTCILRNLAGDDSTLDAESSRAVWKQWHQSHPDFALAAALAGLKDAAVLLDTEREAVQRFLEQERPHDLVLRGAVKYLKQGGVRRVDDGKTHRAIIERILSWLESDWIAAPPMLETRRELAQNLVARLSDEPASVARIFNAEWPREDRSGKRAATGTAWTNYSALAAQVMNTGALLTPVAWPSPELPGVSPLFAGGDEATDLAGRLSAEDAGLTAPLIRHPVLRAWLEDRASGKGHPVLAVTKLAQEANADPAALVLAAASAAEAEKFDEAAQFAQRALERPLSANLRRMLNASLVIWADEAMAEHGSPLHSSAREAALRLRKDAQTHEQKVELAEAMELLSLTAEAKALTAVNRMNAWTQYNARYYNPRSSAGAGRVQMMMLEARRELKSGASTAWASTAKVVRRMARRLLSPAGWGGDMGDANSGRNFSGSTEDEVTWTALLEVIQERKCEDLILAELKADAANPRQRAVFAAAHDLLQRREPAMEIYREVLAGGSTDPGVFVRLMTLLCPHDAEDVTVIYLLPEFSTELAKLFESAPAQAQAWMAATFLQEGGQTWLETAQRVAELATAAVARNPSAHAQGSDWLLRVLSLLREDLVISNNVRAPKLEGPANDVPLRRPNRPDASPEEWQKAVEQLAARRAAHDKLCRSLLSVPGAAAAAFASLRSASPVESDLSADAVAALVTESGNPSATAMPNASSQQQQMMMRLAIIGRADETNAFDLITPGAAASQDVMDYLLARCVKSNSPDALRTGLIPALEKAGAAKLAEQTALLTALYFDASEQVESNARRLVAAGGTAVWPAVIKGLEHRRSDADLSALAISEVTRARTRPDELPAAVAAAGEYCALLCREGRHARARTLLDRLLDVLTGTQRQRAQAFSAAITGGFNQYISMLGVGGNRTSPPATEALELLKQLIRTPAAALVAMDAVYDSVMPAMTSDTASALTAQLDVVNAPFTKGGFFTDAERARQFFTNSPLVADVDKFRSYGGSSGVFFTVAATLYEMGFEERKPALEVLRALPATFGRDVLIAASSDRWNADALNAAAAHFEHIKALPPQTQAEMADLLAALASGRELLKLDEAGRALMKWAGEQQSLMIGEETAKRIEAFVSTRAASASGAVNRQNPGVLAAPLLESAIKGLSPRAYDVVRRVSVLVPRDEAAETIGWLLAGYGNKFEQMLEGQDNGLAYGMAPLPPDRAAFRLGVLTNTLAAGDKRAPLFVPPLRLALPRTVRWISSTLTGTPEERLTALTAALAAQVKEGEACVLLEAFPLPVSKSDTPEDRAALRAAAVAWANGAGKALPRQDLVREIAAAARLEERMETPPGAAAISDEAALPPEQAHYLSVLRDESRGPAARLAVASLLADFAGPWLEPPLVAQVAAVLERSLATRRPVDAWQRATIVKTVSRSAPSPAVDASAQSLLTRLKFDSNLSNAEERTEAKHYLALALRTVQSDGVAKVLAALQNPAGDPDVLGMVLAAGSEMRIANLVRDAEGKVYSPALCGGEVFYDERVAAALPLALEKAPKEAIRFKLELAAHCLPSAPGQKPRVERMAAVAARMAGVVEGADKMVKDTLLDLLTVEPAAALPLREFYEQAVRGKEKSLFERDGDNLFECSHRFWMVCLFADAAEGDVTKINARLEMLNGIDNGSLNGAPAFSYDHWPVLQHLCTGIAHGWPQWDAAKRTAVQKWIIQRLQTATLPAAETNAAALSQLPVELIEAINREVE